MKSKEIEAVSINYSFTAIPTNLIYLLDNDCYKLMSILIQKETYWKNNNRLNNGYFIKSISELNEELGMKNKKDVRLTIEALYRANLVDIIATPKVYHTAQFRINWNELEKIATTNLFDLIEFNQKIERLDRDETITYLSNKGTEVGTECTTIINNTAMGTEVGTEVGTECTTTIDNINNIDNKNNINKEYINNILIEKEIIINNNKEKELEVMETVETRSKEQTSSSNENIINNVASFNNNLESSKKEQTPTKKTFEEKFEILLERMSQSSTLEELDDKLQKLANWLQNKIDNDASINVNSVMVKASEVHNATTSRLKKAIKDTLSDDNSTISITALEDEDNAAESLITSETEHIKKKYIKELSKDIQLLEEMVQFGNSYYQDNYNKAEAERIVNSYSSMTDTYKEDEVIKNKLQIIINLSNEIINYTPKEEPVQVVEEDDDEDDGSIPFE